MNGLFAEEHQQILVEMKLALLERPVQLNAVPGDVALHSGFGDVHVVLSNHRVQEFRLVATANVCRQQQTV